MKCDGTNVYTWSGLIWRLILYSWQDAKIQYLTNWHTWSRGVWYKWGAPPHTSGLLATQTHTPHLHTQIDSESDTMSTCGVHYHTLQAFKQHKLAWINSTQKSQQVRCFTTHCWSSGNTHSDTSPAYKNTVSTGKVLHHPLLIFWQHTLRSLTCIQKYSINM